MKLRRLSDISFAKKTVLLRVDLNVPMRHGKVEDATRITRLVPTIEALLKQNAKVVLLSHFGRPKGEFVRDMSLAPLTNGLSDALGGREIRFAVDCIGHHAKEAVEALAPGEIILLENLRFHAGEEKNNAKFADALAELGDVYVNDTFSCSHRAHASIVGLAERLPSAAGLLLQDELDNLEKHLGQAKHPLAAAVGGSKVSTKLDLLSTLVKKVQVLIIGGAMANTFLKAKGVKIGKSLYEPELLDTARTILAQAEKAGCRVLLPEDGIVAASLEEGCECNVVPISEIPSDKMLLDIGPNTLFAIHEALKTCKTVVWNGPLGAFEIRPFDVGSISFARNVALLTSQAGLISVAGGGDVVAAVGASGLTGQFTYISTAGGAFLEWLEGKPLPGVAALCD